MLTRSARASKEKATGESYPKLLHRLGLARQQPQNTLSNAINSYLTRRRRETSNTHLKQSSGGECGTQFAYPQDVRRAAR